MDQWRSAWRLNLGECICKSIPLLIAVASLCRYPDAIPCLVVRSLDRVGSVQISVRLTLGECTCIGIPLLIVVASLFRLPDAIASACALSGPRRIRGYQRGD